MTKEHLIPLNTRPIEEHRAIARKGGSVRSKNKKRASKYRELKKKLAHPEKIKDKNLFIEKELAPLFADPDNMAQFNLSLAYQMREAAEKCDDIQLKGFVLSKLNELFRTIHGTKQKTESVHINIDVEAEAIAERLSKMNTIVLNFEDKEKKKKKKRKEIVVESE